MFDRLLPFRSFAAHLPGVLAACALHGCVINPVPTPATAGVPSAAVDGAMADASADTKMYGAQDASAAADWTAEDMASAITPEFLSVDPVQADSAATPGGDVHLAAFANAVATSGKLVVLLPAPGHKTADYQRLLTEAARMGHRALALAGPGDGDVVALCGQDGACLEAVRREIADGQDHSAKITVKYADGLENRLIRALAWLAKSDPESGWGQFLELGKPDWTRIIVAGHGQGAAQAMMLAVLNDVARAALLGGPADADAQGPALWLTTHKTASAKIRGFCHTEDPQWNQVSVAWAALGMGGKADRVDVDQQPPPYYQAHQMTTAIAATLPADAIATDAATPTLAGVAKFALVWRGLLGK